MPFTHINANKTFDYFKVYEEEMVFPIIRHDEYSLSEDSPDIAFFVKPYDLIPGWTEQWLSWMRKTTFSASFPKKSFVLKISPVIIKQ